MNKNIFENAKFGDHFKTRDGRDAIYWGHKIPVGRDIEWHYLITKNDGLALYCTDDGLAVGNHTDFPEWNEDIVSRYQKPIDEEKLDRLAKESMVNYGGMCLSSFDNSDTELMMEGYYQGFKKGYRNKL